MGDVTRPHPHCLRLRIQVFLINANDRFRACLPLESAAPPPAHLPLNRCGQAQASLQLVISHRGSEVTAEEYTATVKLTAFQFYNAFRGGESYKFNIN